MIDLTWTHPDKEASPPAATMQRVSTQLRRSATISRRRLLGVGALAIAGAAVGGRLADGAQQTTTGQRLGPLARRRRLRVVLAEPHATKLEPLLARFEDEQDVELDIMSLSPADLYAQLTVDLLQQTGSIDVVSLSDDWIPSLGRSAVLVTDTDLVTAASLSLVDDRIAQLGRSLEDGQLVAVPWTVDVGLTTIADVALGGATAPRRWSEFADAVERSGLRSLLVAGSSGNPAAATFRSILSGYGMDIVEPVTNRPTMTDYEARRAMAVLTRLQGSTSISPLAIDERGLTGLLALPGSAGCAHVWSSAWLDGRLSTGWTILPPLRNSVPRATRHLRAWLLAVPRTAADTGLARTFVEWMLTTPVQRSLLEAGLVPSSREVLGDRAEQEARPAFVDIVRGLSTATARPRLRAFPEINMVCGEAVATVLAGNASPGVAFRAANAEMRSILEREGELNL